MPNLKPTSLRLYRASRLALAALLLVASRETSRAAAIAPGDVTATLGPSFFVDDAAVGGNDVTVINPAVGTYNRSFAGLLNSNQGQTQVTLTGFGFATSNAPAENTATSLSLTFTYLGADELPDGDDDVIMGTVTGTYGFSASGEYVFAFDTPITTNLNITGVRFLIQVAPSDGKIRFKTSTLTYETSIGPKFSVAGLATTPRVNLAKFQPVTTDSVSGQRLASYLTDGVAGNDNRWQSAGSAPHWARVDFPFPIAIGSAQVFSGVDDGLAMTAFKLQYLNEATWTDVPGATISANTSVERNLVFTTPVTASSFRLYNSADGTIRIRELALYPPNGAAGFPVGTDLTLNLAQKRPSIATSNTTGNFALFATDGRANKDAKWQTSTAGSQTLEIDLRATTEIGSAHLYSGSPGVLPLADFVLNYWDGSAWLNIPGGTLTGNTSSALIIPFSDTVTTSKIQLVFTNPGTTSVQELCIFPANDGNSGYPIGTGVIGAPTSHAKFDDFNDGFYQIANTTANLSVVDNNGSPVLNSLGPTTAHGQYQVLLNYDTGTYRLRNRATGYCLSGAQLSTTPGSPLVDAPYSALPDQDWILKPIDSENFNLINPWSGLVVDTQGGGTVFGTALVQNLNTGATSQRWQLVFAEKSPKKGIGGTGTVGSPFATVFNANWMYGWSLTTSAILPTGVVFNPMQWGDYNWEVASTPASTWKLYPTWRSASTAIHLMGFNEPDAWSQSGRSLDPTNPPDPNSFSSTRSMQEAVMLWPRLMAMDQPLVAPCPANMTGGWLSSFYTQASALGYRVDYTAKHSYPSPNGGSSDNLINDLQTGYNNWGRPMWLTEFSFVDWNGTGGWSEEDNYNCLAEFLWRAESISWLRKYALFVFSEGGTNPSAAPAQPWSTPTPAPRSNSIDINGNLTAFGKLYAAWDDDATVRTGKTYLIHNKSTRKRMANDTAQSNVAGRNIRIDGDLVYWSLVSASSGRYYVVSSLDGRRLNYDGTNVSLVAASTTGTSVEWSLSEKQYGWFYLGHPATSKRLKLVYNNTNYVANYTMVANTSTGDDVQWRFIVPSPPPSWTGTTDNLWTTAGNWNPATVPTTNDTVRFNDSSTANLNTVINQDFNLQGVTVTDPSGPVSIGGVNSLTVGNGGLDLSAATQDLTITAPLIVSTPHNWNVAGGRNLTIGGVVSSDSNITITGAGKVSLAASNLLPNGTTVGNLIVNGTLDINGTAQSINVLSGSGIVDNSAGNGVLTLGNNDAVITLTNTLQNTNGTLALVKTGSGNLTLPNASIFSGGFTNNGSGNITPSDNDSFGTGPVVMNAGTLYPTDIRTFGNALTLNGGTLRIGGGADKSIVWSGSVNVTADSQIWADGGTSGVTISNTVSNAGFALSSFAGNGALGNTLSGPISGIGTITVTGGTLNLNAANSFGGTYRAALGILKIGDLLALQNGTLDMNPADSGTVNLNNLNATVGALMGSRNLALGNGVVSIGNNNLSTTYSGVLSGNGSLVKIGNGTLILSNTTTYSGATQINLGTLKLGTNNILPATPISIDNATLDAATFTDSTGPLAVTSTATINLDTGAVLAFTNSSAVDWSNGELNITGAFVAGSSLRFGTDASGLTSTQLAQISAAGVNAFALDVNGYLIPRDYSSWAIINAPTGTAYEDYDNDGVLNGIEYVLGGTKNTNDLSKLPKVSATDGNFIFSFQRDQASLDGTTSVVIQVGTNLVSWTDLHVIPPGATVNSPGITVIKDSSPGFDTVNLSLPQAPDAAKFARLNVTL